MNTNDGGLAKHTSTCTEEIKWENAKIVGREERWTKRKFLEGIESLREKNKGIPYRPLLRRPKFNAGPVNAGLNNAGFKNPISAI